MLTTTIRLVTDFIAQAIVILYPGVFVFWFVFHTRIGHWRKMGKRAYFYAVAGWPIVGLPLLYFRSEVFRVRWPTPAWLIVIGLFAVFFALWVARQCARSISRKTLVGLVELEPQRNPQPILRTGIYSKTRNPIYFAHWLAILAAAALSGFAANWIFVAVDSLLLVILIRIEEKELIARYGSDFREYMRSVPRFVPRWPW